MTPKSRILIFGSPEKLLGGPWGPWGSHGPHGVPHGAPWGPLGAPRGFPLLFPYSPSGSIGPYSPFRGPATCDCVRATIQTRSCQLDKSTSNIYLTFKFSRFLGRENFRVSTVAQTSPGGQNAYCPGTTKIRNF